MFQFDRIFHLDLSVSFGLMSKRLMEYGKYPVLMNCPDLSPIGLQMNHKMLQALIVFIYQNNTSNMFYLLGFFILKIILGVY